MRHITLYRRDYKKNPDDGTSFFEDTLQDLGIKQTKWDDIEEVEIVVEGILNIFDEDGNEIRDMEAT